MPAIRTALFLLVAVAIVVPVGNAQGEETVFDFENGPGPLFEIINTGDLWEIDTDGPTLRVSKPEDPLIVNPQGFIVGGIRSRFCVSGDFVVTVDYELFDFQRDPSNTSTLNESILGIENEVPQVFEVLRFVRGGSDAQRIEAFGPDVPHGGQDAPPEILWAGRYRVTRVNDTMFGAFASPGSENFTTLGWVSGYFGPVEVFCLAAQGVGRLNRDRANTSLDVAFDDLIIDGAIGCYPTSINGVDRLRTGIRLRAPRPNPFSRTSVLSFSLISESHVRVTVQDVAGRRVRLLSDSVLPPGDHEALWDGRLDTGTSAPAGIYYYTLETPYSSLARPVALVR